MAMDLALLGFLSLSSHVQLIRPIAKPSKSPITPPANPPNAVPITAPKNAERPVTHASLFFPRRPLSQSRVIFLILSAKSAARPLNKPLSKKPKSAPISPLLLLAVSLVSRLISSNAANCAAAFFAAVPVPFSASCSSFKFFAASAESFAVLPNKRETISASAETTCVRTFTKAVNAGMMTLTSGCASVKRAPLSRASAADASPLLLTTSPIQSRTFRSAERRTEKIRTRRARDFIRSVTFFMTESTFAMVLRILADAELASTSLRSSPPAFSFAAPNFSSASVSFLSRSSASLPDFSSASSSSFAVA